MLTHKLTAYRGQRDVTDAIYFLKEIKSKNKQQVFEKTFKYRPLIAFVQIDPHLFRTRFDLIWARVHGKY